MIKTETMWAPVSPPDRKGNRTIYHRWARQTRRCAIYAFENEYGTWDEYRKRGWTLERVTVGPAEAGE